MMALEVQVGRRDDAVEILEGRLTRGTARVERHPLRLLEGRALAHVGRERPLHLGGVRGHFRSGCLIGALTRNRQRRADDSCGSCCQYPPPRDGFRTFHTRSLEWSKG